MISLGCVTFPMILPTELEEFRRSAETTRTIVSSLISVTLVSLKSPEVTLKFDWYWLISMHHRWSISMQVRADELTWSQEGLLIPTIAHNHHASARKKILSQQTFRACIWNFAPNLSAGLTTRRLIHYYSSLPGDYLVCTSQLTTRNYPWASAPKFTDDLLKNSQTVTFL